MDTTTITLSVECRSERDIAVVLTKVADVVADISMEGLYVSMAVVPSQEEEDTKPSLPPRVVDLNVLDSDDANLVDYMDPRERNGNVAPSSETTQVVSSYTPH